MKTSRMHTHLYVVIMLVVAGWVPASFAQPTKPKQAVAASSAAWVTQEVKAPRVSFHTFESASAKTKVSYHLYTPAGYNAPDQADRRFPVVYWLHGSRGTTAAVARVAAHFESAIEAGKVPPCLVVLVNGLAQGMYVDWKDGSTPVESVIIKDLVPHIDATYRTLANRDGRLLDGFSMGGYGAARLGFKYPEMFKAVSIIGAGPLQAELIDAPRAGTARAAKVLEKVYGGDQGYFRATSPRTLAEQNAAVLAQGSLIRMVIGDQDEMFATNQEFHAHLEGLKIPHTWKVIPGVGHDPIGILTEMGDENWAFYRKAFEVQAANTPGKTITRTNEAATDDRRAIENAPTSSAPAQRAK